MKKNVDPEKLRDMVRSILPSRHRTGPRAEKALRKRAHRRCVRMDLRVEDHEETAADFLRTVSVSDIVRWRRDGDKLNHFMRWCEAITEGMSREEALGYVRGLLPRNVIGDHAYSHWERHLRRRVFSPAVVRRSEQSSRDSTIFRLRRALRADPDLQRRLNNAIKHHKQPGEPRRLLLGIHDIEAFIDAVGGSPYGYEQDAMLELIAEVEKGGLTAALRVLWRTFCSLRFAS